MWISTRNSRTGQNWVNGYSALARYRNCKHEINCMIDSRDFQDAESVRSGHSHVTSQPVSFPPHPVLGGMLSRSLGIPSRRDGPPSIWDTHGISGNVFANPAASSSAPYPQELNPWSSHMSEPIHSSPAVKIENQTPVQDPRCQSGPSARNSFDPSEGRFFKELWSRPTKTADLGTSLWQIPYLNNIRLLDDKIQDWGMYLFTISYGSYAVDQRSGDGWISGWFEIFVFYQRNSNTRFWSTRCEDCLSTEPNHPEYPLQEKVSLEEQKAHKDDRFFRGRQIAYLIYEYFRVTGANDSVENYADLFTVFLRNDNVQEFVSKWDEVLLSMTQIPSDILKNLYKLRIRESEKLKTVLELYNMEIHQKTAEPDYHRLKTMVKRSIEHSLRMKNFEARNGTFERNAVVKNQETKQRGQRTLGDCWQWEFNGQCSKGDNYSFRHDMSKRAKSTQPNPSPRSSAQQNVENASGTKSPRGRSPSGKMARLPCKDYLKGTCTTPLCEKWHPPECLFYKTEKRMQIWR